MILGNCRVKIYIVQYNSNCITILITVGDMKLARNGAFDNKEVQKMVLDLEWKEIVPGHYKNLYFP